MFQTTNQMISGNETWSRRRMAPHGAPWSPWPLARLRSRWSIQTKHPHARCLKMRGSSMTMQQEPIYWRYLPFFKGLFFKAKFQGISTKYGQKFGTAPEIPIDHGAYPLRDMNGIWMGKLSQKPLCLRMENSAPMYFEYLWRGKLMGNEDEPLDVFRPSHSSASPRKIAESTTYPIGPQAPMKRFITQLLPLKP